ncbi:MAG: hypothetical protein R3Y40_07955 [Eubacteriales bacterium]
MLMEREELKYGIKLGKTQLRFNGKLLFAGPLFWMLYQFVIGFADIILDTWILKVIADEVHFQVMDFSTGVGYNIMFFAIMFVIWNALYVVGRTQQGIYPQTNKSRFVANIIPEYVFIAGMSVCSLIFNGILFFALSLIERYSENTVLVGRLLPVEIGIVGLTVCAYGLLIQSVFLFIASLIRKYKIWCIMVPLVMVAYLVNDVDAFWRMIFGVGGFYFDEASLGVLLLKVVVTHLVLNILSYVLEVSTEFLAVNAFDKKKAIPLAVFAGIVLVAIIIGIGNLTFSVSEPEADVQWLEDGVENTKEESVEVDISHLEEGSVIEVETIGNIELPYIDSASSYEYEITDTLYVTYMGAGEEVVVIGDTLVLTYGEGACIEDGLDIYPYLEPEFTYELEGNTLTISYELNNPNVHILYVQNGMASKFSSRTMENVTETGSWGYEPATLMIGME